MSFEKSFLMRGFFYPHRNSLGLMWEIKIIKREISNRVVFLRFAEMLAISGISYSFLMNSTYYVHLCDKFLVLHYARC